MKINLPLPHQAILASKPDVMDRYWYKHQGDIMTGLGHNTPLPMYSETFIDAHAINYDGAAVVNQVITGAIEGVGFPAATTEQGHFCLRLPNNLRSDAVVLPYIEWTPTNTNTGNVVWRLGFSIADSSGDFGAQTTLDVSSAGGGTAGRIIRASTSPLNSFGALSIVRNAVIMCRVGRVGADAADTYNASAVLVGVLFKYAVAGIGYETEF